MIKLTKNLIRLFEEEKSMLVKLEDLTNGVKSSNITKKLQVLAAAEIIKFSRTDIEFRIEISNMEELQDIHKVLVAIESTDQETKDFLNQVAIELKGKTRTEAIAIIKSYSD